jgi:hypothetical protein
MVAGHGAKIEAEQAAAADAYRAAYNFQFWS